MKTFEVEITETLQRTVRVQADNADQAYQQVTYRYGNEDIVLEDSDFVEVEFEVNEVPKKFRVLVEEFRSQYVEVEAYDEDEAEALVEASFSEEKIVDSLFISNGYEVNSSETEEL